MLNNLKNLVMTSNDVYNIGKESFKNNKQEFEISVTTIIINLQLELKEHIDKYIIKLIEDGVCRGFSRLFTNHPLIDRRTYVNPPKFNSMIISELVYKYFPKEEFYDYDKNTYIKNALNNINIYNFSEHYSMGFYYLIQSDDIINKMDLLEEQGINLLLFITVSSVRNKNSYVSRTYQNVANIFAIWLDDLKKVTNTSLKINSLPTSYISRDNEIQMWSDKLSGYCFVHDVAYYDNLMDTVINMNNFKKIIKSDINLNNCIDYYKNKIEHLKTYHGRYDWGNDCKRPEVSIPGILYAADIKFKI